MACGDITEVQIDGENLVINVNEGMLYNILSDGKRDLENALRWQGLDLKIKLNLLQTNLSSQEEDIKKLRSVVGNKLTIIGGN